MKTSIKGHIFAVITITIWSSTFIVSKILLNQFTPLQILVVRYLLAIVFLTLLYPRFKKPTSIKEEVLFLFIGAALAFYFVFENTALQHTYSSNVSLIVSTIPLLTGILSMVVYKTHFFSLKSIIGFILAYLGVFLIIINGSKFEGVEPIGDFLALGAAAMFAVYSVLMEKTSKDYHMIQLTRKVFLYGLLVLLLVVAIKGQPITFEVINSKVIASMLFLGIVASSLAFILWNNAIKIIGPVKTNQYIYLVPVVTTIMSAWVLKEKITYMTLIGTLLILMGLYLSEKSQE